MFKPRKTKPRFPAQNEVFFSVKNNPSTYEEISQRTGKSKEQLYTHVISLNKKGIVGTVNMSLGKSGSSYGYSSYELVGKLIKKSIIYVLGDETLLGKRIIRDMPAELTQGMKKGITTRLIPKLPYDAAEVIRDYMREHVVCRYPFDTKEHEVEIVNPGGEFAHENFPKSKYATDFVLPLGAPVLAAHEGTVMSAKHDSDVHLSPAEVKHLTIDEKINLASKYANLVEIRHKDGFFTEYAHLTKREVVSEEDVKEGDVIGYVGMSRITSLSYLHINAFKMENEKPISIPVKFIE
ncbi:MAG: peptidoglycan DD-metalloendopeptidase family protein [Candidatus Aenigmarchaeota archaeon]|nr:peptidoglycan DD-metalloendopeptidase family protein [Candidatus Aenigmarchaeota archaeon]